MSTLLQEQETESWMTTPDYSLDQAKLVLDNSCMQMTFTDSSNASDNTSGKCYLFVFQKGSFSTSGHTEAWMTSVLFPLFEFKDVELFTFDTSCLVSAKRTVESFSADLRTGVENVFYNLEDDLEHDPGFIISILVVIPESNRDLEHEVYASLGKLMRSNPELLFDMHIVKRRGRQTRQVVPPEFLKVQ